MGLPRRSLRARRSNKLRRRRAAGKVSPSSQKRFSSNWGPSTAALDSRCFAAVNAGDLVARQSVISRSALAPPARSWQASGVQYAAHVPSPPLSSVVERLWALRDQPLHATERIVPTGTLELVINLRDDEIRIWDREGGACRRLSGAIAAGYFDQAHLINEFRDLAGMSPVAFLAASAHVKVDHAAERSNSSKP